MPCLPLAVWLWKAHWNQSFFENDYLSALISLISTQLPPISISHSFTAFQSMIMHISFPWKFHSWKKWKFENFEQNTCYIPQKKAKNKYNSESGWKSKILEKKKQILKFLLIFSGDFGAKMIFLDFQNFQFFCFEKRPQQDL